jgi:DNA-binding LacI/PurR family transcriptional regulator
MSTVAEQNRIVTPVAAKRSEADRVIRELDALCATVGVGGRLPRHTELMRRIGASERIVLRSLDELQRKGRIVRRHGSGTFVTDSALPPSAHPVLVPTAKANRMVVAIAKPDRSIFDRCMEILYDSTLDSDVSVTCHLMGPEKVDQLDVNAFGDPLGFIVFGRPMEEVAIKLRDAGKRVVIVGAPHVNQTFGLPCVCGNQDFGGYLISTHLFDLGHRNIAYADLGSTLANHPRWQGHKRAGREAEKAGAVVTQTIIASDTVKEWLANPKAAASYFARTDAPTAIAAWNDREALDLIATFSRAGIRVPDDVSVTGYDNLLEGRRMHPSLTTVDHLIDQQVAAALSLVTSEQAPENSRMMIFAPSLIARESTRKLS